MLDIVTQSAHGFAIADLRDHCRVTGTAHDDALTRALDAAVVFVETSTGLFLRSTTAREYFRGLSRPYRLTAGPFDSVTSVTDTTDDSTIATTAYSIDRTGGWPMLRPEGVGSFASDRVYSVTYSAGYSTVPAPIVTAVHEVAALHFENREAATPTQLYAVPLAVSAMLAQYGAKGL